MDIETFREYCLQLPGTTEDVKWGDHLCFMIENKIYVITSLTPPHNLSFKVDPEQFDQLIARPGITQAAHLAKRQWVACAELSVLTDNELKESIAYSRKLVLSKLSKKAQAKYA